MRLPAQRRRSVRRRQNVCFARACGAQNKISCARQQKCPTATKFSLRRGLCAPHAVKHFARRTLYAVKHSVRTTLDAVRHSVRRAPHGVKHSVPELDRDNPAAGHMDNSTAPNSTAPEFDCTRTRPRRNSTAAELDRAGTRPRSSLARSSLARLSYRGRVVHMGRGRVVRALAWASRGASLVDNFPI